MVYKCKNCGAKLQIEKGTEIITCEYCDSVNKVEMSQFDFYRNMSDKTKKYTKWSVIITFGMIAFGIVLSIFMNRKAMGDFSSDEDSYYGTHKYNYHFDGGYLIDIDNDEYMDIISLASNIEDGENYLNILDGSSGERLHSIMISKEKGAKLFVLDQKYICLAKEDFTVSFYDKTELKEIKTLSLSDKVQYYDYSENELYLKTHDDSYWTVDLNSFSVSQNNAKLKLDKSPGDYLHVPEVTEGNIVYSAVKKEKSSKDVFSIIAKKGNETLWNLPLGFEDMTWWDGPTLVVADQNIITFGKKFTGDNMGYVIGIDKTEGRIKYEVQKSGKGCRVYDFYYNGMYVIANINGSFHALDPGTGETKWMAGNICDW